MTFTQWFQSWGGEAFGWFLATTVLILMIALPQNGVFFESIEAEIGVISILFVSAFLFLIAGLNRVIDKYMEL